MQKGNIGVTTENIFPVIKKFLYSDHEIFLREMVSNAVDATQKMKTLAEKGEFKGELVRRGDLHPRAGLLVSDLHFLAEFQVLPLGILHLESVRSNGADITFRASVENRDLFIVYFYKYIVYSEACQG